MAERFEGWAIVELMGHVKLAGKVGEEEIGGGKLLRLDVPAVGKCAEFTRYVGAAAIYQLTMVSEAVARGVAKQIQAEPIHAWDLPEDWATAIRAAQRVALPAPDTAEEWADDPVEDDRD